MRRHSAERLPSQTRFPSLGVLALLIFALGSAAQAEMRDFGCAPTAVKVDAERLEILCAEPMVLNDRSQDRFRQVDRVAFPMLTQSRTPQFGSQVRLLDYYLEVAQSALLHGRTLHVWFETDYSQSQLYGCDPTNCREIVALALTHERVTAPPTGSQVSTNQ